MVLLGLFVRREVGHPLPAVLAAMTLFGVTTRYQEAVMWFSAGFALLALDSFLLALLACQALAAERPPPLPGARRLSVPG